jgi:hypothetical protein
MQETPERKITVTSSLNEISKGNKGGGGWSNASPPHSHGSTPLYTAASGQIFLMTKLTVLPRHKILLQGESENQTQINGTENDDFEVFR